LTLGVLPSSRWILPGQRGSSVPFRCLSPAAAIEAVAAARQLEAVTSTRILSVTT
jgi:hypothetical protein